MLCNFIGLVIFTETLSTLQGLILLLVLNLFGFSAGFPSFFLIQKSCQENSDFVPDEELASHQAWCYQWVQGRPHDYDQFQ